MSEHRTTIKGKPATVEIKDDGHVQVISDGHTWGFTPDLRPESLTWNGTYSETTFSYEGDRVLRTISGSEHPGCALPITVGDPDFASFREVLAGINTIPASTPLPSEFKKRIPAALEIFGRTAAQTRT